MPLLAGEGSVEASVPDPPDAHVFGPPLVRGMDLDPDPSIIK